MGLERWITYLVFIFGWAASSLVVAEGTKSAFGPSERYTTIGGESFISETGKDTRRFFAQSELYATGGLADVDSPSDCTMRAPVDLPSGVNLSRIELFGYDNSDHGTALELHQVCRIGNNPPTDDLIADITSNIGGTPGYFISGKDTDHTINNNSCHYYLRAIRSSQGFVVFSGCGGQNSRWVSTRFTWQRQIKPGPALPTFTDVPTGHPFYNSIEALAESGITGGCGGENYCPDNAITRGQFAAFFARALGLHWPEN